MPGSSNRSNPLAEINFRTDKESSDVSTIVLSMVKPEGKQKGRKDPFWDNCASNLLYCVIMHLMYKHHKENLPLPSLTDIMSFLSSLDKNTDERLEDMMTYQHITPEEFLERKLYTNPLREIYGEHYVRDLKKINDTLTNLVNTAIKQKKPEEQKNLIKLHPEMIAKGNMVFSYKSMARTISEIRDNIRWAMDVIGIKDDNNLTVSDSNKICWAVRDDDMPFHRLLTHPRVAEQAAVMKNGAEDTRATIIDKAKKVLRTCVHR